MIYTQNRSNFVFIFYTNSVSNWLRFLANERDAKLRVSDFISRFASCESQQLIIENRMRSWKLQGTFAFQFVVNWDTFLIDNKFTRFKNSGMNSWRIHFCPKLQWDIKIYLSVAEWHCAAMSTLNLFGTLLCQAIFILPFLPYAA